MLLWQEHSSCYPVSFVMYISCPKFEEHFSNISGDSLDVAAPIQEVYNGRFNSSLFVVRMVLEYS